MSAKRKETHDPSGLKDSTLIRLRHETIVSRFHSGESISSLAAQYGVFESVIEEHIRRALKEKR